MHQHRNTHPTSRRWIIPVAVIGLAVLAFWMIGGRASFDPDKVAESETRMWQAYYSGNRTKLGLELMTLLRSQYGMSLLKAKDIAELLARSSMSFGTATGSYESIVLPDLTEAYRLIQQASGRSFDPEQAARAELAWWVARRTPGQDSTEQVGARIAALYALLYGENHPSFARAGRLRAQAAELRDAGGALADWAAVEELLKQSYRELKQAF